MRNNRIKLLICLAIPLAVGGLATLLSGGTQLYDTIVQPPLSPPGWVFPVVWTVLYLLMGYASYLVLTAPEIQRNIRRALVLYFTQLAANFLWPLLFFGAGNYLAALLCLGVLWVLIVLTVRAFSNIRGKAGDLLLPYLLWVTFAAYLNFGVYLLN